MTGARRAFGDVVALLVVAGILFPAAWGLIGSPMSVWWGAGCGAAFHALVADMRRRRRTPVGAGDVQQLVDVVEVPDVELLDGGEVLARPRVAWKLDHGWWYATCGPLRLVVIDAVHGARVVREARAAGLEADDGPWSGR